MTETSFACPPLPAVIKIGWRTYRIVEWSSQIAASKAAYGETSNMLNEIRVERTFGYACAAQTLLHEILHAIRAVWPRAKDADEETEVNLDSIALATVWHDNGAVMAWIAEGLAASSTINPASGAEPA